jgi:hypothetical protein
LGRASDSRQHPALGFDAPKESLNVDSTSAAG